MPKKIKKFKKSMKKLINRYYIKINISILIVALSSSLCFPQHSFAAESQLKEGELELISGEYQNNIDEFSIESHRLPKIEEKRPLRVVKMNITAYNSLPSQTDSSPCITASGMNVCSRNTEDVVATNYMNLPFGTIIRIPELFGDRQFIIEDRMNARYTNTLDIWMKDHGNARKFGVKRNITVEIY